MFEAVVSVGLTIFLLGITAWLWRASLPRVATGPALVLGVGVLLVGGTAATVWYIVASWPRDDGSESMVDRLPEPVERATLLPETETRLRFFETEVDRFRDERTHRASIAALHDHEVQEFIEREGFGVGRSRVLNPYRNDVPVRLRAPEWPSTEKVTTAESTPMPSQALGHGHRVALAHFLHVPGFGYAEDRSRVFGFEPHGFRDPTARLQFWRTSVERVELVGLLLHAEPVVYETEGLPTMKGGRDTRTRPLDDFETESLKQLRAGEDLTSTSGPDLTRAFGSIRSAKQCVTCHGGERGDLLGAFSYTLRSVAEQKPAK